MEQLPLIVIAACVLALAMSLIGVCAVRWTSFNSRVNRRCMRRHRFEASWGAVIEEAERRAEHEKLRAH